MAQLVKNLPSVWETWVQSLGWEDPLGTGKATPLQYSGLENSMTVWGHKESDRTERLSLSLLHQTVNKGSTVKLLDIKKLLKKQFNFSPFVL